RDSGGLVRDYRCADAETVVVALGSVLGTVKDTVDELRDEGVSIGVLGVTSFRPFPFDAVRTALRGVRRVVVLERALAGGMGGFLAAHVRTAWAGDPYTVIAGLGVRPVTKKSLRMLFADAVADR